MIKQIKYKAESRNSRIRKSTNINEIVVQILYDKIKNLEDIDEKRHEHLRCLLRPFIEADISPKTYNNIINGKYKAFVKIDNCGLDPFVRRLAYILEIPDYDL